MKIDIKDDVKDIITLSLRPQTREEFDALKSIWESNNNFEKLGYFKPTDISTQYGIDNSDFSILIRNVNKENR